MERLRRRQTEELAPPPLPELQTEPVGTVGTPAAPTTVQVIWGPMVENMAAGGMTVGDVRALLQRPYNIPLQAAALVNGTPVRPEHRLAPGDTLEFARAAGEKGAAPCGT